MFFLLCVWRDCLYYVFLCLCKFGSSTIQVHYILCKCRLCLADLDCWLDLWFVYLFELFFDLFWSPFFILLYLFVPLYICYSFVRPFWVPIYTSVLFVPLYSPFFGLPFLDGVLWTFCDLFWSLLFIYTSVHSVPLYSPFMVLIFGFFSVSALFGFIFYTSVLFVPLFSPLRVLIFCLIPYLFCVLFWIFCIPLYSLHLCIAPFRVLFLLIINASGASEDID